MLTVKLYRGHVTKIVEATEVNIFPCGRGENSDADPAKRTNKVRELAAVTHAGDVRVFAIAEDEKELEASHLARHGELFHGAYIENAHGATTETVRPY